MNNSNMNRTCENEDEKGEDRDKEKRTRKVVIEKNHSTPPTSRCKRFGCTYSGCRRTYTTVGNLKTHLKTHSGEYTFRCTFEGCSKTFQSSYNLKIHLRVHTGEKPYCCKINGCEKVFSNLYRMKVHQRLHSGKTFDCKFESCEKVFNTMKDLRRHERTHTGERPFRCEVAGCGSAFTVSHHLKDHLRTHAGDKPFICNERDCVKAFSTSSQLKMHLKTHSREKSQFLEMVSLDYGVHKTTSETEVTSKSYLSLEERIAEPESFKEADKTVITQQQNTSSLELDTDAVSKTGSSHLEVSRTPLNNIKQTMPVSQSLNNIIELSNTSLVASIRTKDKEYFKDLGANQTNMEANPEQRLPNILGICSLSSLNDNSKSCFWQPVDPYEDSITTSTATLLNSAQTFSQPLPTMLSPTNNNNPSVASQPEKGLQVSDCSSSGNIIFTKNVLPEVNNAELLNFVNPSSLFLPALPRPVYPECYPFLPFPNLFAPPLLSQLPTPIQQSPESSIVVRDNTLVVVSGAEEFPLTSADNSVICLE